MSIVLVLAAHADDETLGCGGTLLRHVAAGDAVHWCVATAPMEPEWSASVIEEKEREVAAVADAYGFAGVHRLRHPAAALGSVPASALITQLRELVKTVKAEIVYSVAGQDVHGDHRALFAATIAALKPFRSPVRRYLVFETPSSTDIAFGLPQLPFMPSVFVDIEKHLDRKMEILELYRTEIADAPFPRSAENLRALARVRGAAGGYVAAEAFQLIYERL